MILIWLYDQDGSLMPLYLKDNQSNRMLAQYIDRIDRPLNAKVYRTELKVD